MPEQVRYEHLTMSALVVTPSMAGMPGKGLRFGRSGMLASSTTTTPLLTTPSRLMHRPSATKMTWHSSSG